MLNEEKKKRDSLKEIMSVAVAETGAVVPASEKKTADKNDTQVRNWMLALGLGVGVAVVAAGTVYYVKSQRAAKMKAGRYSQDLTVEQYEGRLQRWWGLTTKVFSAVRSSVSEFMSKKHAPLVPATQMRSSPYDSTEDRETVLGESDF